MEKECAGGLEKPARAQYSSTNQARASTATRWDWWGSDREGPPRQSSDWSFDLSRWRLEQQRNLFQLRFPMCLWLFCWEHAVLQGQKQGDYSWEHFNFQTFNSYSTELLSGNLNVQFWPEIKSRKMLVHIWWVRSWEWIESLQRLWLRQRPGARELTTWFPLTLNS